MNLKLFFKFLLPSLIGVGLFLVPLDYEGNKTILLAVFTSIIRRPFEAFLLEIIVSIVLIAAIGGAYNVLFKPKWKNDKSSLSIICNTSPLWFSFRIIGAIFAIMVYFEIGPEIIWSPQTGLTVFRDIGATIFFIITVACFLMPFLTEYGFMEFAGTLLSRAFGLLFKLPGRAAIDAMASFLSSSNVGLLITISQYEKGHYTTREAASIAVNFSVVSVSFSLLMVSVAGIEHLFVPWYLSVIATCVLCAIIMVRIPPLSRYNDTYFEPANKKVANNQDYHHNLFLNGIYRGMARAGSGPGPLEFIKNGWQSAIGVVFGVLGPSMAVGTTTIILMEHTNIFYYLSYPVLILLQIIGFPEAQNAAPGLVIGFLDQFMPAIVASRLENELAKFILAGMAVTQLIYMSEVGLIILRSSLPLKFRHLAMIFALRSVISFPFLYIAALIVIG